MKYLILFVGLFSKMHSFGQSVTNKELIGKNFIDTTNGNGVHAMGLFITDSSSFRTTGENDFRKFQYRFDEDRQLIFVVKGSRFSYKTKKFEDYEYGEVIKVIDSNTLQRTLTTEFSKKQIRILHRTN